MYIAIYCCLKDYLKSLGQTGDAVHHPDSHGCVERFYLKAQFPPPQHDFYRKNTKLGRYPEQLTPEDRVLCCRVGTSVDSIGIHVDMVTKIIILEKCEDNGKTILAIAKPFTAINPVIRQQLSFDTNTCHGIVAFLQNLPLGVLVDQFTESLATKAAFMQTKQVGSPQNGGTVKVTAGTIPTPPISAEDWAVTLSKMVEEEKKLIKPKVIKAKWVLSKTGVARSGEHAV